ncbi:hypothetical protein QT990_34965, partial [Microcoleus sp. T3_B1]
QSTVNSQQSTVNSQQSTVNSQHHSGVTGNDIIPTLKILTNKQQIKCLELVAFIQSKHLVL